MVSFRLDGRPSAFWRGDWYVGKGVAWAKVRFPSREEVSGNGSEYLEVFNTHLHAPYNEGKPGKDTYKCHRVSESGRLLG